MKKMKDGKQGNKPGQKPGDKPGESGEPKEGKGNNSGQKPGDGKSGEKKGPGSNGEENSEMLFEIYMDYLSSAIKKLNPFFPVSEGSIHCECLLIGVWWPGFTLFMPITNRIVPLSGRFSTQRVVNA